MTSRLKGNTVVTSAARRVPGQVKRSQPITPRSHVFSGVPPPEIGELTNNSLQKSLDEAKAQVADLTERLRASEETVLRLRQAERVKEVEVKEVPLDMLEASPTKEHLAFLAEAARKATTRSVTAAKLNLEAYCEELQRKISEVTSDLLNAHTELAVMKVRYEDLRNGLRIQEDCSVPATPPTMQSFSVDEALTPPSPPRLQAMQPQPQTHPTPTGAEQLRATRKTTRTTATQTPPSRDTLTATLPEDLLEKLKQCSKIQGHIASVNYMKKLRDVLRLHSILPNEEGIPGGAARASKSPIEGAVRKPLHHGAIPKPAPPVTTARSLSKHTQKRSHSSEGKRGMELSLRLQGLVNNSRSRSRSPEFV